VGSEVIAEGVRAGTHWEGWSEQIPDCTSWNCARQKKCRQMDWYLTTWENEWNDEHASWM